MKLCSLIIALALSCGAAVADDARLTERRDASAAAFEVGQEAAAEGRRPPAGQKRRWKSVEHWIGGPDATVRSLLSAAELDAAVNADERRLTVLECADKACPEDKPCLAKRASKNKISCKDWGPNECARKPNAASGKWEATKYCPFELCDAFEDCPCVGEKANGARKCLGNTRSENQCDRKETNPNNDWVMTSWCESPTMWPTALPTEAAPTLSPTLEPVVSPTFNPTARPTVDPPTTDPTGQPTAKPTVFPTAPPTTDPTAQPTVQPTTTAFTVAASGMTFDQCESECAAIGGRLPCISDDTENDMLIASAGGGECTGNGNLAWPWLGIRAPDPHNGVTNALNWDWDQSFPPTCSSNYTNWTPGEPNDFGGVEDCAEVRMDGDQYKMWNDVNCGDTRCCVCDVTMATAYADATFEKAPDLSADANAVTFDECETACASIGARLPCIADALENGALLAFAQNECDASATGLENEGTWLGAKAKASWSSGLHPTWKEHWEWPGALYCPASLEDYDAWSSQTSEPNDTGGNEDCAEQYYDADEQGQWNDIDCDKKLCCVCDVANTALPTAGPTTSPAPTISLAPTKGIKSGAEKIACFQRTDIPEGEHCGTCCTECTAVVGMPSLESNFNRGAYNLQRWRPNEDFTGCACLDLAVSGYNHDSNNRDESIALTSFSDCARITGDDNTVFGMDGDDAIYTNGEGNFLVGGYGNDHLTAEGDDTILLGSYGDDYLTAKGNGNNFQAHGGNDYIMAEGNGNWILGGYGNDTIYSKGDDSDLIAEEGDDHLTAEGNDNRLFGGSGDDHLTAEGVGNALRGDADNDVCTDLGDNTTILYNVNGYSVRCESCYNANGAIPCPDGSRKLAAVDDDAGGRA